MNHQFQIIPHAEMIPLDIAEFIASVIKAQFPEWQIDIKEVAQNFLYLVPDHNLNALIAVRDAKGFPVAAALTSPSIIPGDIGVLVVSDLVGISYSALDYLLEHIECWSRDNQYCVIHLEHPTSPITRDVLRDRSYRLISTNIQYDVTSQESSLPDDIRLAQVQDRPFLLECLTEAFVRGADLSQDCINRDEFESFANQLIDDPGVRSLILEGPSGPCGHATFRTDNVHRYTDEEEYVLIDILTRPPLSQKGHAHRLMQAVVGTCCAANIPSLAGQVVSSSSADQVLSMLNQQGWEVTGYTWQLRLHL